jgi:hypothetical protein
MPDPKALHKAFLSILAKALGVSLEQLLGLEKVKDNGRRRDTRLWRRFSQVEKLPPHNGSPSSNYWTHSSEGRKPKAGNGGLSDEKRCLYFHFSLRFHKKGRRTIIPREIAIHPPTEKCFSG